MPISDSSTQTQRIQRDALNLLQSNNLGSIFVTFLVCLAFIFGFPNNAEKDLKLYWFFVIMLVFVFRLWDMYFWQSKLKGHEYDITKPLIRFRVSRYVTSILLSAYPVLLFDSMDVIELSCTIVIVSALSGGSATILAADKSLACSYAPILLVPFSIVCLMAPESYQNIFGFLGLAFAVVMYLSAKSAYAFTAESILIKHQNTDLLVQMELKNQEISQVNASLESKVKKRTEKIFELSNIDPLTKLFNRNAFSDNLTLMLDSCELRGAKLAVLFIDLDGFKSINDSHGHPIGDQVLVETAARLTAQVKLQQGLCRWGGDEFLIALQGDDVDSAYEFALALIRVLSQPIYIDHHELTVGATIGIAMYPEHGTSGEQLIALSDTAMYVQKLTAKSDVCIFTEQMRATLDREIELKNGLTHAIRDHQLFVVFQPVVCSQSKKVSFCEVLLRWDLNGSVVSPAEFIPVAEQHGLIHSVGAWVLEKSCELATKWTFDETVDLSVNVSVSQLMRGDLVVTVKRALEKSGFPAKNLHIEVTESIFAQDIEYVLAQVKTLQRLGIKVSIDDFGTGFSSLALLQSLSADVVKIDRRFIASIDQGGKAIIQATQHMASELGFSVVAEGVETESQAQVLCAMGIDCLQGYYFAKPMEINELVTWHRTFQQSAPLA